MAAKILFQGNMISNDDSIYQVSARLCDDCDGVVDGVSVDSFGSPSSDGSSGSTGSGDETCRLYDLNVIDFETGRASLKVHLHKRPRSTYCRNRSGDYK